ncbi:MAG: uracil phosphoribosyltransferase [Anaerolineales bacterium]|nr:uracil phosphoribosyltransferase [Anaerolineales bacterium]
MAKVFQSNHPLIQHKLALLRDVNTEPKRFRELVREVTWLLLYEATEDLTPVERPVTSPMGNAVGKVLEGEIAFAPILRAGLTMVGPALEMIPAAHVWHIGLYREEDTLQPIEYYTKVPKKATAEVAFILDPMLATGGSATAAVDILKKSGVQNIKFVGLIAAPEGIERLSSAHPEVPIHIAAVDQCLNEIGYIVPGLGDAGDRLFGT